MSSPHTSLRRAALLEQLLVALASGQDGALAIGTRAPDDPTIALLDAWATVGDVLGFYLDRIAEEGYLSTALEPGSILALAALTGTQPLPGLAAQTYLAYTMAPDPADAAVAYDPGLLFQTQPAAGQQPQTFESADAVLARPSWGTIKPRTSGPIPADASQLVVTGTSTNLAPNSVLIVSLGARAGARATQVPATVSAVTVDYTDGVTGVKLAAPIAPAAGTVTPGGGGTSAPGDVTSAIDGLATGGLATSPPPVPGSATALVQTPKSVFAPGSDAVPRLLSTLRPDLAAALYPALGSTAIGAPPVTGAHQLQVTATPFGANAPPQPVFDGQGRPAGTRPWPIGDTFTLTLTVTEQDFAALWRDVNPDAVPRWLERIVGLHERMPETPVVQTDCSVGTVSSEAAIAIDPRSAGGTATPEGFGEVAITVGDGELSLAYAGSPAGKSGTPRATPALSITAAVDSVSQALILTDGAGDTQTWDPEVTPFDGRLGGWTVAIAWSAPAAGQPTLTIALRTPLPLANRAVIDLDTVYPAIVAPSAVVIVNAELSAAPVIRTVTAVQTVSVQRYGLSGKATRLTLDDDWIGTDAVFYTALAAVNVYAQPSELTLRPAPITGAVAGRSIDLGSLVAGMEPGRLIAVTGMRDDLPGGATVAAGEIAMVAGVTIGGEDGATAYSTLQLASPLAYGYRRDTVTLYGNVVRAHQGATITQVLGGGQPSQAPQSFTLSSGPVLADPIGSGSGARSTLTVTVDGVGYAPVARVDAATPPRSYIEGHNASGKITITFPAPLPPGTGNVVAVYRAGDGSQGNAAAGQISQLLTRPAGLAAVSNPLPARGGLPGSDEAGVRAAAPRALTALDRIVTVGDYAALAAARAGVADATAAYSTRAGVTVTIAGSDPTPLEAGGALCAGVAAAIAAVADPAIPCAVVPATLYLIGMTASVVADPLVSWEETVAEVQAALLARFGYAARRLGQDVPVADLAAAAHAAPAVLSFRVTGLALLPATATAAEITALPARLSTEKVAPLATLAAAADEWKLPAAAGTGLAFVGSTDTLFLTRQSA